MSRIGKKEIIIPKDVSISLSKGQLLVTGIHGSLEMNILKDIQIIKSENKLHIQKKGTSKEVCAFHGLTRALIYNMIFGVTKKFSKILIVEGVGYKFQIDKNKLLLIMGYSHSIELLIPNNLEVKLDSATKLTIFGIDKQKVGLFASEIRKIRPPEPYKGKGIRYQDEVILRKVGKTGK